MDIDAFVLTTDKKLKSNWSAYSFVGQTGHDLDKIRNNFDKFDKKTKMKIIISLVGMKKADRSMSAASIKRLLSTACDDRDEWVPVVAGLVHEKLFPASDSDIQCRSDSILETAVSEIYSKLPKEVSTEQFRSFASFQSTEASFFSRGLSADEPPLECTHNPHFTYTGDVPDFVAREERLLSEQRALEQLSRGRASLMPAASFRQKTLAPSSSTVQRESEGTGMRGGKAPASFAASAFGGRALPKKTAIAVSDSKIRDLEKKRKLEEDSEMSRKAKAPRPSVGKKVGSAVDAPSVSCASAADQTQSPSAVPPAGGISVCATTAQPPATDDPSSAASSQSSLSSSALISPSSSPPPTPALSNSSLLEEPLVHNLLDEGNLLSPQERQSILDFFAHKAASASGTVSLLQRAPLPEQKFKMFVREKLNDKGEKVQESNYLKLTWDGSIHKWTRSIKVKAKKVE